MDAKEGKDLGFAAFIQIDVVEERLNIGTMCMTAFGETFFEPWRCFVVPSTFTHELVPNLDIFEGRTISGAETPIEDLFISLRRSSDSVLGDAIYEDVVVYSEEFGASFVESLAKIWNIIGREFTIGVESNFINHSAEIADFADAIVWAAKVFDRHRRDVALKGLCGKLGEV